MTNEVFVYGGWDTTRRPYHLTRDGNEPLCWRRGMSKLNDMTPGYDNPAWVKPKLVLERQAIAAGARLCRHCVNERDR